MPYQDFYDRLVNNAMELACRMMRSGAEVRNVEKTVDRLCRAYGAYECSVFAIASCMIATIRFDNNIVINRSKRIAPSATALDKLEAYNKLSRQICAEKPDITFIEEKLEEIEKQKSIGFLRIFGYIIGAGAFTVFVGGNFLDFFAAAIIGALVFFCDNLRHETNKLIYTLLMCVAVGCIAIILTRLGLGSDSDKITIGGLMLFMPTLTLCNSVKDMLHGDIFTGVYCFIDALLTTLIIALGVYFSNVLLGGLIT